MKSVSAETIQNGFRLMEAELTVNRDEPLPSKDAAKIARWIQFFAGVPEAAFIDACMKCVLNLKFFPKVSEVKEFLVGKLDDRAELMFNKARENVRRLGGYATWFLSDFDGDGAALYAVDAIGIDQFLNCDVEKRPFLRAEFRKVYRAAAEAGKSLDKIAGICERNNRLSGITLNTPELFGRSPLSLPPELSEVCREALERPVAALPAPAEAPLLEMRGDGQEDISAEDSERRFGKLLNKLVAKAS